MAASSCSSRSWVRAFSKTSTGALGGLAHRRQSVGCAPRWASVTRSAPVESRRDLKRFVKLPFRLHRDDPQWVRAADLRAACSSSTARRTRSSSTPRPSTSSPSATARPVGRITAQVDERWDEYQGGSDGMFGFFETEDDPEVAAALLDAAAEWVRRAGAASGMLGPMDFTTNDEVGLLIEGYELRADDPRSPGTRPTTSELIEGAGLRRRRWTC